MMLLNHITNIMRTFHARKKTRQGSRGCKTNMPTTLNTTISGPCQPLSFNVQFRVSPFTSQSFSTVDEEVEKYAQRYRVSMRSSGMVPHARVVE